MIDPSNDNLGIEQQCKLLSISRSGWYYEPKGEPPLNLKLLRMIDEQFLATPTYGSRKMAHYLRWEGYCVGRQRVRGQVNLMRFLMDKRPTRCIMDIRFRGMPLNLIQKIF